MLKEPQDPNVPATKALNKKPLGVESTTQAEPVIDYRYLLSEETRARLAMWEGR